MAQHFPGSSRAPDAPASSSDPLGVLIEQHEVTLAGVLLGSGVLAILGLAALGYGLLQKPGATVALIAGAGLVLAAVVLGVRNFNSVGCRLELRRGGVRFRESGTATELFWEDIVAIDVGREDTTNLGVAAVTTRSSDALTPSGPLTNTEWQVAIRGQDGRIIHLGPNFLRMVPDPKALISHLRLRAERRRLSS